MKKRHKQWRKDLKISGERQGNGRKGDCFWSFFVFIFFFTRGKQISFFFICHLTSFINAWERMAPSLRNLRVLDINVFLKLQSCRWEREKRRWHIRRQRGTGYWFQDDASRHLLSFAPLIWTSEMITVSPAGKDTFYSYAIRNERGCKVFI